jgi:hypothetical protein
MRELGIDPVALITETRLKAQEKRRLQRLPAFALVQLLYQYGFWIVERQGQPNRIYIEGDSGLPSDVEMQNLGYQPTGAGGTYQGAPGETTFDDIVAIDRMFYGDRPAPVTHHAAIA